MDPKRHDGPNIDAPARVSPYPQSRLAPPHDLVAMAQEIERADAMVRAVTGGKLEHIARQMRALKEEAERTLVSAQRDADLHRVACGFRKRPGQVYHVYERADGSRYFSMLAPQEWGQGPPHAHVGSYRLEADMSFTPAEDVAALDRERLQLRGLLK